MMPMKTDIAASRPLLLRAAVLISVLLLAGCEPAEAPSANEPPLPVGELAIEEPWARPGAVGGTSAVYLGLANGQAEADTLVEVRTPVTDSVTIHETHEPEQGTTAMRPVDQVPIPAQQRVALAPEGTHIMLVDLAQPLQTGSNLILDLEFAGGEVKRLSVPIRETPPITP